MGEFEGRVAIVTGSTSGIGEATARSLVAAGAKVVVNSSSSVEAGEVLASELGTSACYHRADVAVRRNVPVLSMQPLRRSVAWTFSSTMPATRRSYPTATWMP